MKDSKTILFRHFILSVLLETLAIAAIAMPSLQPARERVAAALHVPQSALWIAALALLVLLNAFLARRLRSHLVEPLVHLVNQTKLGAASFAFKKKSMNTEEDTLKHFIESNSLRFAEMEQEVQRMEELVQRAESVSKLTPDQVAQIEQSRDDALEKAQQTELRLAEAEKELIALERRVDELKRELKTRNRELESIRLGDEAVAAPIGNGAANFAYMLAEKLHNPLSLIANLSWRLAKSWDVTSPIQFRDAMSEINKQSEEQLEMLKKYQRRDNDAEERDAI